MPGKTEQDFIYVKAFLSDDNPLLFLYHLSLSRKGPDKDARQRRNWRKRRKRRGEAHQKNERAWGRKILISEDLKVGICKEGHAFGNFFHKKGYTFRCKTKLLRRGKVPKIMVSFENY